MALFGPHAIGAALGSPKAILVVCGLQLLLIGGVIGTNMASTGWDEWLFLAFLAAVGSIAVLTLISWSLASALKQVLWRRDSGANNNE